MLTPSGQTPQYHGINRLERDATIALQHLNGVFSFASDQYEQHSVITLEGPIDTDETVEAIAVYLVTTIAGSVQLDLDIREKLFDVATLQSDLYRDVVAVIGETNHLSSTKRQTERDPWMWEGISHLVFHLSAYGSASHPPERIVAKTLPKTNVKDHGLDIILLYGSDSFGISAAECKAYLQRPGDAITDAANQLKEVDDNARDSEIRGVMAQFTTVLSKQDKERLVGTFWREERAYFPMVCCDFEATGNWGQSRQVITRLKPPPNRIFLVPLSIENAKLFFDRLADAMRHYVGESVEEA